MSTNSMLKGSLEGRGEGAESILEKTRDFVIFAYIERMLLNFIISQLHNTINL